MSNDSGRSSRAPGTPEHGLHAHGGGGPAGAAGPGGHSLEDLLVPPVDPLDGNTVYGNLDFALVDDLFSMNGGG